MAMTLRVQIKAEQCQAGLEAVLGFFAAFCPHPKNLPEAKIKM